MSMDLTGITNQNEYYTNHYFSSIFEENASETISAWRAEVKESEEIRTPWALLRDVARQYYPVHDRFLRSKFDTQTLVNIRTLADLYLRALGYPEAKPEWIEIDDTLKAPVYLELTKANGAPALWILLATSDDKEAAILDKYCFAADEAAEEGLYSVPTSVLTNIPNEDLITKTLFGQAEPPRFILLIGMNQIALIDRNKWNEKRYLQFELEDIFSRHEESTLQAMAVLLHRNSLCPEEGTALLDELDANSQKHAAGVSQDLKYALRESIEILGNEVLYDMATRQGRNLETDPVDAGDLTLECLREKEKMIQKQLDEGIDYAAGEVTVIALLERYISLKQGVRYNTKVGYNFVLNLIKKEDFGYRQIRDIKVSDAQQWIMKLHNDGKGYSTITSVRGVVKPAFQMAYNEDIIRRNPFDFKLVDVVPNDSQKRIAMTEEQQELWMGFIRNDKTYAKYYDEFVVLLGTGMRVSEFCGLTKSDLDFESRKIRVDHQLVRERGGKYYVEKTKTECGCRFIPMTEEVYRSLKNILVNHKKLKTEMIVDGYSSFLLLDKDDKPKVALHIENEMRWAMKKYKKFYPEKPLPHITPHVFRHTFCTNMANAGMDIKTLQYVMGHSDVGVTLNVYTHASYDRAAEQMAKILDFKEADMHGKQRKSG